MEVSKGRELEREDMVARESFAQQVRDDELAAGECPPTITASLRSGLIGDQWNDPDCEKACTQLLHSEPVAEDTAPGARRLASDFGLEERVPPPWGSAPGFQSSR